MNITERSFENSANASEFSKTYFSQISHLFNQIDTDQIQNFITELSKARKRGSSIFILGNGGSASTASHFANDLLLGAQKTHQPFRAISLSDNSAVLTCIGNDQGFENIFQSQLEGLLKKEDVVIAITASGNSININKALSWAKGHGAITLSMTGFDGGETARLTHFNIHVPTPVGDYGIVESIHATLEHLICNYMLMSMTRENLQ
ncbi:MAG: D-sedoheptulose 7-phosphate isomerase [Bdellovibrio sp.]